MEPDANSWVLRTAVGTAAAVGSSLALCGVKQAARSRNTLAAISALAYTGCTTAALCTWRDTGPGALGAYWAALVVSAVLFAYCLLHEKTSLNERRASALSAACCVMVALNEPQPTWEEMLGCEERGLILRCWCFMLLAATAAGTYEAASQVALPMVCGLLLGPTQLLARVREADGTPLLALCLLHACSCLAVLRGVVRLEVKSFAPATVAAATGTRCILGLLFVQRFHTHTLLAVLAFVVMASAGRILPARAEPRRRLAKTKAPMVCKRRDPPNRREFADIQAEHGFPAVPTEASPWPPRAYLLNPNGLSTICRSAPLLSLALVTGSATVMPYFFPWTSFCLITFYIVLNAYKYGLHVLLGCVVGLHKVKAYEETDFREQYEQRTRNMHTRSARWQDIVHFVIVPNYSEDEATLEEMLESIARSPLALGQIGVCMGMEAREAGVREKAARISSKYRHQFKHWLVTEHPPNLPGEIAGKSSNTRWAAQKVREYCTGLGLPARNVVLTVSDADSDFHPKYFCAVNYHYLMAGDDRKHVIWQAPIQHYKNYYTQPALVRVASVVTTAHEFANISDPSSTRLPYSTYSLSMSLADCAGGWDPDWISEDWHMMIKCFLVTGGKCRVEPIFLPTVNYAVEGNSLVETLKARWDQGKRHALGFSEASFFLHHVFHVGRQLPPNEVPQYLYRAVLLGVKIFGIHLFLGTMPILNVVNRQMLAYYWTVPTAANSWVYLFNVCATCLSLATFTLSCLHVRRELSVIADRIRPATPTATPFFHRLEQRFQSESALQRGLAYAVFVGKAVTDGVFWGWVLFVVGGMLTEWIAAFKSVRGHKFKYVVAIKPTEVAAAPSTGSAAGAVAYARVLTHMARDFVSSAKENDALALAREAEAAPALEVKASPAPSENDTTCPDDSARNTPDDTESESRVESESRTGEPEEAEPSD